jgi:starch synthase
VERSDAEKINVLFLSAEAAPWAKVGGLADVAGSLPRALRSIHSLNGRNVAIDIRLVLPLHARVGEKLGSITPLAYFNIDSLEGPISAHIYQSAHQELPIYLIGGPPIDPNGPVYTGDEQDGEKYTFFSLASFHLIQHLLPWQVDILHANDWHTALTVYMLRLTRDQQPALRHIRSLLTIHNLPYMGQDARSAISLYSVPPAMTSELPAWAQELPLPMGLWAADHINAVSPTYAEEILTPEYGCGLEGFLQRRRNALSGILNGLDVEEWNPASDSTLTINYDYSTLEKRRLNKIALLREMQFEEEPDVPLLVIVSRLDHQKGIDLALAGLYQLLDLPWRLIILGKGDPNLEQACQTFAQTQPQRVRSIMRLDITLARKLYAGGDILLMPSRYEPCGLTQMIAMRYGCIPLARATGGLKDTIHDDPECRLSTGFLFSEASSRALVEKLKQALVCYSNRELWQDIQKRAMQQDFSWDRSARAYIHL